MFNLKKRTKEKKKDVSKVKNFFLALLDENNEKSTKRFVVLISTFLFTIGSILVIFFFGFLILKTTTGNIEFLKVVADLFKTIFDDIFYIIIGGLGFMTAKDFSTAIVERAKALAQGPGNILIQNADNVDNTTSSRNIIPDIPENP